MVPRREVTTDMADANIVCSDAATDCLFSYKPYFSWMLCRVTHTFSERSSEICFDESRDGSARAFPVQKKTGQLCCRCHGRLEKVSETQGLFTLQVTQSCVFPCVACEC